MLNGKGGSVDVKNVILNSNYNSECYQRDCVARNNILLYNNMFNDEKIGLIYVLWQYYLCNSLAMDI